MPQKSFTSKELALNLLFSVAVFSLVLGSLELACRLKYRPGRDRASGIYEYDRDKVFALRKNLSNVDFLGSKVSTNSLGYRDDEIPVEKGSNRRVLVIGDSVSFGYAVDPTLTYPGILESALNAEGGPRTDVINTAVPGNAPFQEYIDLKRGLIFKPDTAVFQFVLNDLTQPLWYFKRYGGTGYQGWCNVMDVPYWHHILTGHSALYLFLQDVFNKSKYGTFDEGEMQKRATQLESELSIDAAADPPKTPRLEEAWAELMKWLQKEADLIREKKIRGVFIVSPYRMQFFEPRRIYAQKRLGEWARQNGLLYIDVLELIQEDMRQRIVEAGGLAPETTYEEILKTRRHELESLYREYFLDDVHYAVRGHKIVGDAVYALLKRQKT